MARYDFVCYDCNKLYENIEQSMNEKHTIVCPHCKKEIGQFYGSKSNLAFSSECACGYGCASGGWAGSGNDAEFNNFKKSCYEHDKGMPTNELEQLYKENN